MTPEIVDSFALWRDVGLWNYTPRRSIRTRGYRYIHNFTRAPNYVDTGWLGRFGSDRILPEQLYGAHAPNEGLYGLESDPHGLSNLAYESNCAEMRQKLQDQLFAFLDKTENAIPKCFAQSKEDLPDVPLWEKQTNGSHKLGRYSSEGGLTYRSVSPYTKYGHAAPMNWLIPVPFFLQLADDSCAHFL